MSERLLCPDTTVIIKYLTPDERDPVEEPTEQEFWTADRALLNTLGDRRPAYVRELGA
ncbi:MAG: hypothetical protein ACYDCQ_02190 [Dehalococcoidia bacterium]